MLKIKVKSLEAENNEARETIHKNYQDTFDTLSEPVRKIIDKFAYQMIILIQRFGGNFDHLTVLPHRELLQICQNIVRVKELEDAGIDLETLISMDPDKRLEILEYAMPIRMLMTRHLVTLDDIFDCEKDVRQALFNFWEEIEMCCENWNVDISDILALDPVRRTFSIKNYYQISKALKTHNITFGDFMTLEREEIKQVATHPYSMASEKIMDSLK